jgi:cytochrome bd ubiquinol oxidase subunit I
VSAIHLADAASAWNLLAAREQMALSLGWHIVVACFGVGMPALTVFAEWRGHRTGNDVYVLLARRWARAMGVLFAVGAVSGTILSFEMGLLWPGLMGTYGEVIGLPFAIEGIAFFLEAIFLGIYLYAWDRMSPRQHMLTGIPIFVSGVASAFFVVSANSFMNQPRGFELRDGKVVDPHPLAAMFNEATPHETVHMILAAFMVAGFGAASVYAVAMLRGKRDDYHRIGFLIPFTFAIAVTPVQIGVGDWSGHFIADHQPVKLAAVEGLPTTEKGAPLHIGGIYVDGEMKYAIEIPDGLSLLAHWRPNAEIQGLDTVPARDRPPVNIVHWSFDIMVGLGFGLLALGVWFAIVWRRKRRLPGSRWFLRLAAWSGVAAVVALEAGWVTTEVGRQPWTVYSHLRTSDAVNPASGLWLGLVAVVVVYTLLTVGAVTVLRRIARTPLPSAPQEAPVA